MQELKNILSTHFHITGLSVQHCPCDNSSDTYMHSTQEDSMSTTSSSSSTPDFDMKIDVPLANESLLDWNSTDFQYWKQKFIHSQRILNELYHHDPQVVIPSTEITDTEGPPAKKRKTEQSTMCLTKLPRHFL